MNFKDNSQISKPLPYGLSFFKKLAVADWAFYLLPAIMILLVIGTVAQKYIGLFAAQEIYFHSFFFWLGPVPLPGGFTLIGLFAAHLFVKFIVSSEWRWRKSGIILSHLGALILLIGGLFTTLFAKEYYMIILEGQQTPFIYDYHKTELAVFKEGKQLKKIRQAELKAGKSFNIDEGLSINILDYCWNCNFIRREEAEPVFGEDISYHSMAQFMALTPKHPELEPEENISGVTFSVQSNNEEAAGVYIAFQGMPQPIEFTHNDIRYAMIYGKTQYTLPFRLRLEDFRQLNYPGLEMAEDFESDIVVVEGKDEWPVKIEMNKPFQYQGYTFFQSSFERNEMGEHTILSVVKNDGRLFPYIGTLVIMAGLLLHILLVSLPRKAGS